MASDSIPLVRVGRHYNDFYLLSPKLCKDLELAAKKGEVRLLVDFAGLPSQIYRVNITPDKDNLLFTFMSIETNGDEGEPDKYAQQLTEIYQVSAGFKGYDTSLVTLIWHGDDIVPLTIRQINNIRYLVASLFDGQVCLPSGFLVAPPNAYLIVNFISSDTQLSQKHNTCIRFCVSKEDDSGLLTFNTQSEVNKRYAQALTSAYNDAVTKKEKKNQ